MSKSLFKCKCEIKLPDNDLHNLQIQIKPWCKTVRDDWNFELTFLALESTLPLSVLVIS